MSACICKCGFCTYDQQSMDYNAHDAADCHVREGAAMRTDTATHTPGPWHCSDTVMRSGATRYLDILTESNIPVVFLQQIEGNIHADEFVPNARILAASPDLLTALQQIVDAYETGGEGDFDAAQKAIAKATGATQ